MPRTIARSAALALAAALAFTTLTGCGGGPSDVVGGGGRAEAHTTLTLVAYAVPEPGWSKVIPAFYATEQGLTSRSSPPTAHQGTSRAAWSAANPRTW